MLQYAIQCNLFLSLGENFLRGINIPAILNSFITRYIKFIFHTKHPVDFFPIYHTFHATWSKGNILRQC
jgi:hypothetical protein